MTLISIATAKRSTILILSKDGSCTSGTYLRIGAVVSQNTGIPVPDGAVITFISASSSTAVSTSTVRLLRRTAVGAWQTITGTDLIIPSAAYNASMTCSIALPNQTEIACILQAGTTRSNLVVAIGIEY